MRLSGTCLKHLQRTKLAFRAMEPFPARVAQISNLSPTTKKISLAVSKALSFHAGQWIDFIIPGEPVVGGYSICSTPQQLAREGTLDIVVKRSPHPPAVWVHEKCHPDAVVQVRVGGDVHLHASMLAPDSALLFVAGGIGISPLYGMLCAAAEARVPARAALLYCAATSDELIFKSEIDALASGPAAIALSYHVTRPASSSSSSTTPDGPLAAADSTPHVAVPRRITIDDITEAMKSLGGPAHTHVFLCGPPSMLDTLSGPLHALKPRGVHFEKWW